MVAVPPDGPETPVSLLSAVLADPEAKRRLKEELRERTQELLDEEAVSRHLQRQVEAKVDAEVDEYVRKVAPWYRRLLWLLGVVGVSGVILFSGVVTYFSQQRKHVEESIHLVGLLAESVLNAGKAVPDFRRQQAELELKLKGSKRWELVDRLGELELLGAAVGKRLANLMALYVGGEISKAILDRRTESTLAFSKGLSFVSDVAELQDTEYKKRAPEYYEEAISKDEALSSEQILLYESAVPLVERASYAEPRVNRASLLITEFSDASCCASSLTQALERLTEARSIIRRDREKFYARGGTNKFLSAEIEYQVARAYSYLAMECDKLDRPSDCRMSRTDYESEAIERLKAAQMVYREWDGASKRANPRYTSTIAKIYLRVGKDLVDAEKYALEALDQANERRVEYFDALNLMAWIYAEGFADYTGVQTPRYRRKAKREYYSLKRSRAIWYAYRALATVTRDTEEHAEGLATLAATLRNFGLDYQAVVAEYKAFQISSEKITNSAARDNLRARLCARIDTNARSAVTALGKRVGSYEAVFYRGRLRQVLFLIHEHCPRRPGESIDRAAELTLLKDAEKDFSAALANAAERGGFSVRSEVSLALNRTLLANFFPAEARGSKGAGVEVRPGGNQGVSRSLNPINLLDRLEIDQDFLQRHFLTGNLRTAAENNIAWTALLSGQGYPGFAATAENVIALSAEAALASEWTDPAYLHTLASALYRRAVGEGRSGIIDQSAFEKGSALVADLSERPMGDPQGPAATSIGRLKKCFEAMSADGRSAMVTVPRDCS